MAKSAVSIRGLTQTQRFFYSLVPRVKTDVKEITATTVLLMEGEAKERAPVNFGKLRQSIKGEITMGGFGGGLSANVLYWAWVEFGTGGEVEVPDGFEDLASQYKGSGKRVINRAAQPFLIPAYLKYRDKYVAMIEERLNRILR